MAQNHYDVLNVSRNASIDEIKKAFKKAALQHHPDKGGDIEKFKACNAAAEVLTDEHKRASYNDQLLRLRSRDGLGGRDQRVQSADRAPQPQPQPQAQGRGSSVPASRAPARPPRPPGAVEIPSDPSALSIKELRELLASLGIDDKGALDRADLLELLEKRRKRKPPGADPDVTPRGAPAGAWESQASPRRSPQAQREAEKPAAAPKPTAKSGGSRALRIKVLSLGSGAVGKSCLIKRFCEARFVQKYITTIGIDYGVKPVKMLGQDMKINFFDTSGGDEFADIREEFYDNTNGAILVYDISNRTSFTDLERWIGEAKRHDCFLSTRDRKGDVPFVVLCANKTDLPKRAVPKSEGMQFASDHGMTYFEVSAASGENVEEAMNSLFEKIARHTIDAQRQLGVG